MDIISHTTFVRVSDKFSDNWEITRVLQLSLFTNHTFAVTNFHNCPQSAESVRQSSDKIIANTIRSGKKF